MWWHDAAQTSELLWQARVSSHQRCGTPQPRVERASRRTLGRCWRGSGGILRGCDRIDAASPWHVVSCACVEWMDRVRRGRVLGCRIWSDLVGVAGYLVWSPQGWPPRLPPWRPTLGFGVSPRCGEDNAKTSLGNGRMAFQASQRCVTRGRNRQDNKGSHRLCASRCSNLSPYFRYPYVLWEAPQIHHLRNSPWPDGGANWEFYGAVHGGEDTMSRYRAWLLPAGGRAAVGQRGGMFRPRLLPLRLTAKRPHCRAVGCVASRCGTSRQLATWPFSRLCLHDRQ